jgi:hypothetical protein
LHVSKRFALHGLNISMAVFTGLSAYGLLLYFDSGLDAAIALPARTTLLLGAGVAASIAGIAWFGIQLDRRKAEERRAEEERKAEEAARKGRRASSRPG